MIDPFILAHCPELTDEGHQVFSRPIDDGLQIIHVSQGSQNLHRLFED